MRHRHVARRREVQELGPARDVVHSYLAAVNEAEAAADADRRPVMRETAGLTRIGSGEMRVTNVEFRRADGSASASWWRARQHPTLVRSQRRPVSGDRGNRHIPVRTASTSPGPTPAVQGSST